MNKTIDWWTIKVRWSDGREEFIDEIPDGVAQYVDDYLTELEEEAKEANND